MIYVDTSVVLAQLLAEDRRPPADFWAGDLVASRLLGYEAWNRIHALGLADSHATELTTILGHLSMLELVPEVLARALQPFPVPVRTLDALHLASASFLASRGQSVFLASYDVRLIDAARAIDVRAGEP